MRKYRQYFNAADGTRHGSMICTSCCKPIAGQYRCRDKPDRFVVQHRECTASDPSWSRLDANDAARIERSVALRLACVEFREKWGISELDDLIGDEAA